MKNQEKVPFAEHDDVVEALPLLAMSTGMQDLFQVLITRFDMRNAYRSVTTFVAALLAAVALPLAAQTPGAHLGDLTWPEAEVRLREAPPILHGWFPAFREFPGTEIEDADLFRRYAEEVARSLVKHGAHATLLLDRETRQSSGTAGCNRFTASYTLDSPP